MNSAQFKQGLLGGSGMQSPVDMPQAPEPTMPMMPMPSADPSPMQMSPMPQVGNRGQDTPNERDYLEQLANSQMRKAENMGRFENYGLGSRGVDTPNERDYLQNYSNQTPTNALQQRGAPTENENDFLGQFVNNAKRAMGGGASISSQQDYLRNVMQGYNKRYGSYK